MAQFAAVLLADVPDARLTRLTSSRDARTRFDMSKFFIDILALLNMYLYNFSTQ